MPPVPPFLERVPLYPDESAAKPRVVCVTGASGYVAGVLVERLLLSGHTVHATVRDPKDTAKVSHLLALPGAVERLKLFAADLLQAGSFDEAVAGCECVMHTASPFLLKASSGKERQELIEPAVKGVEHVLAAVERAPSVKRVVLTSSVAAMYGNAEEHGKGHAIDENDWNTTSRERVMAYSYSKLLAEKRAWEIANAQSRWDMVVINPALVLGPPTSSRVDGASVSLIKQVLRGDINIAAPYSGMGYVDVRDVAAAHCLAMVKPTAKGRYVTVAGTAMFHDIPKLLAELYPNGRIKCPRFFLPKWFMWLIAPLMGMDQTAVTHTIGFIPVFNNSKIQAELGLKFTELKVSLADMTEDLAAKGMAKRP